jgi:coenzyme F420-reducing hydrogenase delta subunit
MYGLDGALIHGDENDECHCKDGQGNDDFDDVHQAERG